MAEHKRSVLVDADVGRGARTASGQSLKDDGRVESREARSSNVRLNVDPTETQLGSSPHRLHREELLQGETYRTKC